MTNSWASIIPNLSPFRGLGFSLEIERLHQALLPTEQLPQRTRASEQLVVAECAEVYPLALAHAQNLRDANPLTQVEIYLRSPDGTTAVDRTVICDHARKQSISEIVWIRPDASIHIEVL
jgi:ATP phosphoribosyltransferase regulatory subunit